MSTKKAAAKKAAPKKKAAKKKAVKKVATKKKATKKIAPVPIATPVVPVAKKESQPLYKAGSTPEPPRSLSNY